MAAAPAATLSANWLICQQPFPGRPASLARLCAKRTVNKGIFPEKQTSLFFWENALVLYARELACSHRPNRRKQVWFTIRDSTPEWVSRGVRSARKAFPWDGFQRRTGRKAPDSSGPFGAGLRGPQRPEIDPVDQNPGLRPAQANSEGGPVGPGSRRPRTSLPSSLNTKIKN